jgi:hypothetical protein
VGRPIIYGPFLFVIFAPDFEQKTQSRKDSTMKSSRAIDWIIFLVSTVIMIFMLLYMDEWFWVALPFSLTYLVKALDMM